MVCFMLAGPIRGSVEVLVLGEVSVEAGAEVDLVIGSRFKLASNCRKGGYYAKRRWYRAYWARHWRQKFGSGERLISQMGGRQVRLPKVRLHSKARTPGKLQPENLSEVRHETDQSFGLMRN